MKKKVFILTGLVLLLVLISGFTFAVWDNLTKNESDTVNLAKGATVTVTNTTDGTGKKLVPAGVVLAADEAETIEFKYTVEIDKAPATALDLDVAVSNVKVNDAVTYSSLVIFNINGEQTSTKTLVDQFTATVTTVEITVIVNLTEPGTEVEYLAVAEKNITFDISFTARP
jgi:hypothetical protein